MCVYSTWDWDTPDECGIEIGSVNGSTQNVASKRTIDKYKNKQNMKFCCVKITGWIRPIVRLRFG